MIGLFRCRQGLSAAASAAIASTTPRRIMAMPAHPSPATSIMMMGRSKFVPTSTFYAHCRPMSTSSLTSSNSTAAKLPNVSSGSAAPGGSSRSTPLPLASIPPLSATSAADRAIPSPRSPTSFRLPKPPGTPADVHENIYTIPNAMSLARLLSTPVLGYLIVKGQYDWALGLFAVSAVTDLLDGFIARTFDMKSVLGTILDPMADKALMTTLTVSLGMAGVIPVPLASLIIGRDVGLVISSFVIRYKSLPPPKTFTRFWDISLPSAEVRPTTISKINTALQLLYMGAALSATSIPLVTSLWATCNVPAQWVVATTTVWSGLSYVFSKDAVTYLQPPPEAGEARDGKEGERKS